MTSAPNSPIPGLVDHWFRHQSGRMVASLTRIFGPQHLDLAEDVVQEALVRALHLWPFQGVPEDPKAWLVQVAKNLAIDTIRRQQRWESKVPQLDQWLASASDTSSEHEEIQDDTLRLMFMCCHESIPREAQIALTLKVVGGFSVAEIAAAFLATKTTIAQRIVRAKHRIRELHVALDFPPPHQLPERLHAVLEVLYLMFNEGYASREGPEFVRQDVIQESMRLTRFLANHETTSAPATHALMALMHFQAARLPTRQNDNGQLLLLAEQPRELWNQVQIQAGCACLQRASSGDELTRFHLEAGIASCHALAPSFDQTEWDRILFFYDLLAEHYPSPIVFLNRAVAVAMNHGPERGWRELQNIPATPSMEHYSLWHTTRGELLRQLGRFHEASDAFRHALRCTHSPTEQEFLHRKLEVCDAQKRD